MTRKRREDALRGLYGTPSAFSQYANEKVLDDVPGPGFYSPKLGSFGSQLMSQRKNGPSALLLGKWRSQKPFTARSTPRSSSPNTIRSRTGKCAESAGCRSFLSGPKFAQSLRPDIRSQLGVELSSPGPAYDIRGLSRFSGGELEGPRVGFTRGNRFLGNRCISVGPGEYKTDISSLDRLKFSNFTFGESHRAYDHVRRPGADQDRLGRESSGPGDPLWRDIKKEGSKAHSFNVSPRFERKKKLLDLGPGEYYRPLSRSSTCSSIFGSAPRRSRLDFREVRYLARV